MNTDLQNDIQAGHVVHLQVIPHDNVYYIVAVGSNPAGGVMCRAYYKETENYVFGRATFTHVEHVREALANLSARLAA